MLNSPRFDPAGFILEHYVDGDLLDMSEPIHKNLASPDNLHVWGESTLHDVYVVNCAGN
jgi:hypothetical protein